MTRIILIRHAEAEGNIRRIFQGHIDGDVSENGLRQLECLAERCRLYHFDAVYSSPLMRARKTAEAANRYHGLPIETMDALMEINAGHWEGRAFADLPELFPEEFRLWEENPGAFAVEGGESMREVYDRTWNAIGRIVAAHPDETVCVVSHGCAIRNLLCRSYGKALSQLNTVNWCDNTAVSIIDYTPDMRSRVVLANDSSHLGASLSTLLKQDWWQKNAVPEDMPRERILGIDFGDARTGVSLSDPEGKLASPVGVVREYSLEKTVEKAARLAREKEASEIVVGYPKNMNGTLGERARKTEIFVQKLGEAAALPVLLWDERCTTLSASVYLNATNTRGEKRKNVIDAASAVLILQDYLDYRRRQYSAAGGAKKGPPLF